MILGSILLGNLETGASVQTDVYTGADYSAYYVGIPDSNELRTQLEDEGVTIIDNADNLLRDGVFGSYTETTTTIKLRSNTSSAVLIHEATHYYQRRFSYANMEECYSDIMIDEHQYKAEDPTSYDRERFAYAMQRAYNRAVNGTQLTVYDMQLLGWLNYCITN